MKHALRFGVLVVLIALVPSACGGGAAGGSEHQQAKGRPLPKYGQASLPAGRYHTTEFEPSLSFRIPGDDWRFEGPSGTLVPEDLQTRTGHRGRSQRRAIRCSLRESAEEGHAS